MTAVQLDMLAGVGLLPQPPAEPRTEPKRDTPTVYQVWRRRGEDRWLAARTLDPDEARAVAIRERPVQVWTNDSHACQLRVQHNGQMRGPLAPPKVRARDEAIRRDVGLLLAAVDARAEGARLRDLHEQGVRPERVRQLVAGMREGKVTYKIRGTLERACEVPQLELELVRDPEDRRYLVVRRVSP